MQPLPKGGYIVDRGGGPVMLWAYLGGLGACSPRRFWKFRLSDSYFGAADLVASLALK